MATEGKNEFQVELHAEFETNCRNRLVVYNAVVQVM